jgi:hypothetical protein
LKGIGDYLEIENRLQVSRLRSPSGATSPWTWLRRAPGEVAKGYSNSAGLFKEFRIVANSNDI